ncbi:MAG: HlyC/CorC family transporter [Phycisphaerales bacterium]|nr:HlyC/CorC family transporter [Phycisphaerales bacterium]
MLTDVLLIGVAALLVAVNGFFVAAEFALVKVRPSRIDDLVRNGRPFAKTARWLVRRMDKALSACQLGITMASLGLGWVGEPAFSHLLEPLFAAIGVTSPTIVHTASFIVAFTVITAIHLVIGEQAPKIFALRRPELLSLWCAPFLKAFYVLAYPMLHGLDATTGMLLRWLGVEGGSAHGSPHTEDEIRALLSHAHAHGELTRSEHRLLNAVFEFDDTVTRQIMVPRLQIATMESTWSPAQAIELVSRTKHTRYPLCEGSLDQVVGVVHIKDLVGVDADSDLPLRSLVRPVPFVPEAMPIKRLLRQFQASHTHLALVVDEYGTVVGMVTLENVVERLVGQVQDEFDDEPAPIVSDGPGRFVVLGSASIVDVNRTTGLSLLGQDVDTIAGLLVEVAGRLPTEGSTVALEGATAQVLEVSDARVVRLRLVLTGHGELPSSGAADVSRASRSGRTGHAGNTVGPADTIA